MLGKKARGLHNTKQMCKEVKMTEKTYKANIKCPNCKWSKVVDIPQGTTKQDYKRTRTCPRCGCSLWGWG